MKKLFALALFLLTTHLGSAQILQIQSQVPSEIIVCGESTTFEVQIHNISASNWTNPEITIGLPEGISYVNGSLNEVTNQGLNPQNTALDSALVFTCNTLSPGDSIVFSIDQHATAQAVNHQSAGGVFRNQVNCNTAPTGSHTSASYNILYPALSILSVSPSTATIISGGSTTRTITLINGGNGRTNQVYLTDERSDPQLSLNAIDKGILTGDTIILTGPDFSSIGNGDQYLDQNESITLTQTLSGTSCNDITVTSAIKAHWGCDGQQYSSSTSYANTSIDFQSPNLKLSSTEDLQACLGGNNTSGQQLIIRNTGSGVASSIVVELFKSTGNGYDQSIFSRIDPNSITYKTGQSGSANPVSNLVTTPTQSSGDYSCLGSNPIGKVSFTIPNLQPGDTAIVDWNMLTCCLTRCQNDAVKGWSAEIAYSDICNLNTYNQSIDGQDRNDQYMTVFTESPADLSTTSPEIYTFIISSFENTLPMGQGASYKATFQLDPGLTYQSLRWHSNGIDWIPDQVNYNSNTQTVTAIFPALLPFIVPKSEMDLELIGTCGTSGWKTIDLKVDYVPDTTCSTGCEIPLACNVQTTTYLHCPLASCNGFNVLDFQAVRTNLGTPDNNLDGLPDGNGSLDPTKIKTNRAMVGDTIQTIAQGIVTSTTDTWVYAGFTSSIDYGSVLTFLSASARVYDASNGSTIVVNGLSATATTTNTNREFKVDLSSTTLAGLNPALTGYTFANGDSILLQVNYRVDASVSGLIKETTFLNDLYLSDVPNPSPAQKENCNFKNARLTLIGYGWRNDGANNVTITACSKNVNQNFGMTIGDYGSNYGGGNLFPYEYRHWGTIKTAQVIIPPNYILLNTSLKYYATRKTNSVTTETLSNISPTSVAGDTLTYDISQYFNNQLRLSDDGWNGRISVELAPTCDVPTNTFQDVTWTFNYETAPILGGQESGFISANGNDRIRYRPSSFQLSSANPIQDAMTRQVSWDLKVKNTSTSGADHAWVHLDAPSTMTVDSITFDGGNALTQQNDLFLIGTINANNTADLTIYATISNCDTVQLTAYSGFECSGYPNTFADFACGYEQLDLSVEPKEAAYQQRISAQTLQDPCVPMVELTLDITSVKMAHMYDMSIDLITPDTSKIKVVPGSSQFQYNLSNPYATISEPALAAGIYNYNINNYDPDFASQGIPGVLDFNNNRYRLKMILELGSQFIQGDFLDIKIEGANACAVSLPTVNLAYDPNSKFQKDNTAGLHLDTDNSWSASWGDYDNDGYDDLFVPVNELNMPNILYHNNGNGTFTKANVPPLTTDPGTSISGTWGDYDNDGYLDLFVTNNVNSPNRLYHNNGDGTFTPVLNSPIVDEGTYSHAAAWADYNQDGNLDLVVTDFHATDFNRLFQGDGQGGFTSDQNSPVALSATSALGIAWGDYDNDGDPDLFVANTNGENNQLYRNDKGKFSLMTTGDIVNDGGTSVGGVWGDYDNDGDLDLYVTNSGALEPNFFYENNGDGSFTKVTAGNIIAYAGNSHGASWIDFDNDGDLDLIVANDQDQANFFFSNNGNKTFTKISNAITEEANNSYGTAWSDFDNDGDYDLFIANRGSNANDFFINEKGSCTNHIKIKLIGCNSNSYGVGALIQVKANLNGIDKWQSKHVSTQTSAMGGQNSHTLLFGLLDATSVDSVIVNWPSGVVSVLTNPTINQLLTIAEPCGSKICGIVYHDANENGVQDSLENGIPNQELIVEPGGFRIITQEDGSYEAYLLDGTYTINQVPDSNWTQLSPTSNQGYSLNLVLANQSQYCGNDFGNRANCTDPDLNVSLGTTAFRRGLPNDLHVSVTNTGAYDATDLITLTLTMSEDLYLVDGGWDSTSVGGGIRTYVYKWMGLPALSDTLLELTDSVAVSSNLGDIINLNATISYAQNECNTGDNTFGITENVVGSLDPNDKLVSVKGKGSQRFATPSDTLVYKIRFQNLGTYAARIVTLIDTLSEDLDWSTFHMESSSHPFAVSLVNGVITWRNDHIELPDSTSDPEGSQGYVSFSILPRKGLSPYTVIENTADIQFDYNGYIRTNTTRIGISYNEEFTSLAQGIVYPNPSQDQVHILAIDEDQHPLQLARIEVSDLNGRTKSIHEVQGDRFQLGVSKFSSGSYFIRIKTVEGYIFHQKLIVTH